MCYPLVTPEHGMGHGRGWRVTERTDGRTPFQGWAWDPHRQRYVRKSFARRVDADAWAKAQHHLLATGLASSTRAPAQALLDGWLADLERRGAVEPYRIEVRRILESLIAAGMTDLRHPRAEMIATAWLAGARTVHPSRRGQRLSPASLNRYLRAARSWGNWCVRRGHVPTSPFRVLEPVLEPRKLKPVFSIAELRTLVEGPEHPYRLMVWLMIYTGCRLREAAHLRWEHVDWSARRITIRLQEGYRLKHRKERVVVLQPELAERLRPLAQLTGFLVADDVRVTSTRGHVDRFRSYLATCHVPVAGRTPHSCRHSWVSMMLATGENQLLVQLYAGHESLATTAGYARSQVSYLDACKAWPRGELQLITQRMNQNATVTGTVTGQGATPG